MTNLTDSNSTYLFKLLQDQGLDQEAMLRENPLATWSPNETDFTSNLGKVISVEYVNPQGAGTTEALAASTANPSAGVKFLVPQRHYTMNAGITRIVLQNAKAGGSESEFADALINETDGVAMQFGNHLERQMWGTYLGYRGTVLSFTTTTTTFTNPTDTQTLENGMTLEAVDPGGGTPVVRSGTGKITAINRTSGVVTGFGSTACAALANGDYIVQYGDFTNATFNGVQDWCPETVSGTDTYLGLSSPGRAADRERLAGIFYDGSGKNIRNAFIGAIQHAKTFAGMGFKADAPMFVHPKNYQKILESVEPSKIVDIELETSYSIGLKGIQVFGHKFVEATFCPINTAFLIGKGAFIRGSAGTQPSINAHGQGNSGFLYVPDTGVLSFTMSHDGNCYTRRPYQFLRVKLPTFVET